MSDSPVAPDGAPTPSPSLAGRGEIENPEGEKENEVSSFEELAADPEIAALLDFKPVPRKSSPPGAWTPEAQRQFIAWLAVIGSQGKACGRIGKDRGGATKLYNSPHGASFRAAWHGAIELFERRQSERLGDGPPPATTPPTIDGRRKRPGRFILADPYGGEDEEALARQVEERRDSISTKLLNARRLYLHEIADSPGKRAAFEILTELPIDWEKADRLEPQLDEPWRKPNMRNADMLLTAENGWMGDMAHGPDKKAELRKAMNDHLIELGQPPIDWATEEG